MQRKAASVIILTVLFITQQLLAQKQNNKWYFGNEAALDFNGGSPVSFTSSALVSIEGCASVADAVTGNTLFYTNGQNIWNANDTVMPNGSGLSGGATTSSTQGVLIVAYPNSAGKYLVFTVDETNSNATNGFRYSVVDMGLDNGLGDVVPLQKNILIQANTTERLAVARKGDGQGFWVLIHERGNNIFKAYEVTAAGLNTTPVISASGLVHSTAQQANGDATMGCLKFNNAFNKAAVALYAANQIQIFDFDNCTGLLTNPVTLNTIDNPYGIEFSPDDSKLYYSLYYNAGFTGGIYQVNLQAASIPAPAVLVGTSSSINNQCIGALQSGPDGKIYAVINSEPWLSAITQPNLAGSACGFVDKAVTLLQTGLSPSPGILGLPQKVLLLDSIAFVPPAIEVTGLCQYDTTQFFIAHHANADSIVWNFGDLLSNQNTGTGLNAAHVYKSAGDYIVTTILWFACKTDTLTKAIRVVACDTPKVDCKIAIPNAFTPNNDGKNDQFYALTTCPAENWEFLIFDRWGEQVFKALSQEDKWDGNFKGAECPAETYVYQLKYTFPYQSEKKVYGAISLVR